MLNEKKLAKHLERTWKAAGYKIVEAHGMTAIEADGICVTMPTDKLPRRVLGILAEHTGYIPEDTALEVRKDFDNQTILEVDLKVNAAMNGQSNGVAYPTMLSWGAAQLFQTADLQVFGLDQGNLEIVGRFRNLPIINAQNKAAAFVEDSITIIMTVMTKREHAHLGALGEYPWTQKDK